MKNSHFKLKLVFQSRIKLYDKSCIFIFLLKMSSFFYKLFCNFVGHTILLEGVSTGSATLTARFSDHHFNAIAPTSLDLMVVASLVLQPSVVYVPVQANVKFSVFIIKQNLIEGEISDC